MVQGGQVVGTGATEEFREQWARSAIEIEARLRSYFSPSVVTSWEVYSWAVDRFTNARSVSAAAALQEAVQSEGSLDPGVADAAARLLVLGNRTLGPAPTFKPDPDSTSETENYALLREMVAPELKRHEAAPKKYAKWTALEKQILVLEQAVADQVLEGHAAGFSTTKKDLLHDLMP